MSVTLLPAQTLGFPRPLTQLVKRTLAVTNTNAHPVAFKVKTTAPKQYCVRPNSGRIEPGETVQVQVLLQPMKEDPAPGAKCRDKFLVQSVIITPERETSSLPELWTIVEKEDKAVDKELASIHEQKIRCSYLPAEGVPIAEESEAVPSAITVGSASVAGDSTFKAAHDVTPPQSTLVDADTSIASNADASYSTPAPENGSTSTTPLLNGTHSGESSLKDEGLAAGAGALVAGAAAVGLAKASTEKELPQPYSVAPPTVTVSTPAPAPVAAAAPIPPPQPVVAPISLEVQLANAQKEIQALKAQLASATATEIRQRKTIEAASSAKVAPAAIQHPGVSEGVSLQVVASLVAGTFVFTWLFF